MTEDQILNVLYEAMQLAVRLSLPFLVVSMVVGVIIAIFQAATQIHEQTMTFVPKFLAILAVMALMGGSMLVMIQDFFREVFGLIGGA